VSQPYGRPRSAIGMALPFIIIIIIISSSSSSSSSKIKSK
jgi:hypothetical protein